MGVVNAVWGRGMGYKYCTRYHCPCVLLRLFDCVRLCVRRLARVCKRPILALLTVFMLWKVAGDAILQRTGLWSLLGATRHISGAGMAEKALSLDSISGNLVQNVRTKEVRSADSVAERTRLFEYFTLLFLLFAHAHSQMVTLGSFWQDQTAVIMFMRRFG